ncbi:hypothetical protein MnTg02_02990 [bacterium MnTg02]|nr:hypothetical protein MnTg02_02990 [bacterium MnTg02]
MHRFPWQNTGSLNVNQLAIVSFNRPLAVNRIAERINDTAEKALAHGHIDNRSRPLDRIAFLDGAVVPENHDTDIIDLEIEGHAANAAGKFNQFAGLHIVEAVNAGNTVAHRQDLTNFGNLGLFTEILNLLLQNRGDFCGPNIHQPTSFMAILRLFNLVRSELSIMRLPTLTIRPPRSVSSTLVSMRTSRPTVSLRADLSASI